MHGGPLHQQQPSIWLVAGTGEGPALARALLERGWRVVVSVVTAEAARAYGAHPLLTVQVGALADRASARERIDLFRPRWVVDATHPFALRISALLQAVCAERQQPLLTLFRPEPQATGPVTVLPALTSLGQLDLRGERLLLAIGSRHLRAALALSNADAHFARVLDRPGSLQLALSAGLGDGQLACLRPDRHGEGAIERALCRRWRISAVLCRQSGGPAEALWRSSCAALGLRLLLLQRPPEAAVGGLSMPRLLDRLGEP